MPLCDAAVLQQAVAEGLRPDPRIMVSEWADQFRELSSRASSEPGRWRTSRTPYLREVMDTLSRLDPTQQVVMVAGAQLGKTEAGINWIGATIDGAPGPMLVVQPSLDIAKRFSKQRVTPLIEETPQLRAKVKPSRERDSGNTMLSKEYAGGILLMTGANSGAGLRSMPIRDLFCDEIDAYPADVSGEGDPVELAIARTRTFSRRKVLLTSTPTIAGASRIWAAWEQSDQRVYKVPCPDCGHLQQIEWERIQYDPADIDAGARLGCESCGVLIEERHKGRMLSAGVWEALNPGARVAGFHISSLYSPIGWYSWTDAVRQYEKARDNTQRMRVFTNTVLGLPFEEEGDAPAWEPLYRRRESYPVGKVPEGGLILVAGCDVQHDRLEVEVVAYGPRMESWSVLYEVLPGDTSTIQASDAVACPWRALRQLLDREFPCAVGGRLGIARLAVDAGDQSQVVYRWVRQQRDPRVMATKGQHRLTTILGMPTAQDVTERGRKLQHGIKLWPLGSSVGKRELYGWLRAEPPLNDGDDLPYGWCHFPDAYGEQYFQGLTAEELRKRVVKGFPEYFWEKVRARNEPLDCRVMARGALASLGADRWDDADWQKRAETIGRRVDRAIESHAKPADDGGNTTQRGPERARRQWIDRQKRKKWLGR